MNKVVLVGHLVRDAELLILNNSSRNGIKFTLAVDREYKDTDGQRGTDFIPVVYFTEYAHKLINHLLKSRLISVSGKIKIKSLEKDDGTKKYFIDIEADNIDFLDAKKTSAL